MTDKAMIERINQRLDELRISPRAASLRGGGSADMLRLVLSGRSSNPRTDTLAKMAKGLETSTEWLLHGTGHEQPKVETAQEQQVAPDAPDAFAAPLVPVIGTALGSVVAGRFEGTSLDQPVEYVPHPPGLRHASGLYAVFVAGESMSPEHKPGDLRFVAPHRPCLPGDTVVAHTRHHDTDPGQHYIKRLISRTGNRITLEQINPPALHEIDTRFIVSLHKVLTFNECFGV